MSFQPVHADPSGLRPYAGLQTEQTVELLQVRQSVGQAENDKNRTCQVYKRAKVHETFQIMKS